MAIIVLDAGLELNKPARAQQSNATVKEAALFYGLKETHSHDFRRRAVYYAVTLNKLHPELDLRASVG